MTPERLAEIRALVARRPMGLQIATEILAAYDSCTTEIATLKGEVERLSDNLSDAEQDLATALKERDFNQRQIDAADKERDTLRTQRDALVTAAQNLGATRNDGYPVYDRVSPFMMDALSAAVADAKKEKE